MLLSTRQFLALALAFAAQSCAATSNEPAVAVWNYEVGVSADGDSLTASAEIPSGDELALAVAEPAQRFIHDVQARIDGRALDLALVDDAWHLPKSSAARRMTWRFDARAAARAIDDIDLAALRGSGFVGSLASFLLRDEAHSGDARFRLRAQTAGDSKFTCVSDRAGADGWAGSLRDLSMLPTCAFGAIDWSDRSIDGLSLELVQLERRNELRESDLVEWLFQAETSVERYLGAFPVRRLLVIIGPNRHRGVGDGRTRGYGGASIWVSVSRGSSKRELDDDWVLTHEMIHLALPSMPTDQHWLEEGSATYLEPIVAARGGRETEKQVWFTMLDEFPQGLPEAGDRGLDFTPTWGRTYYGGAIFWLEADVAIRERTRNARSVQDVFIALRDIGGNVSESWPIERVIEVGDRATGTNVLAETYARFKDKPEPSEIDSLWKQLGVAKDGSSVTFDDSAPLAWVRRELVLGKH